MKLTLCGSSRFEQEFHEWNEKLTLTGHVVYGLAVYPSFHDGNKDWYGIEQKQTLDLVHLAKIDNSDAIVVINVNGYIGESTRREIEWARVRAKTVYYTNRLPDQAEAVELLLEESL
jgi:hypothetical protein